MNNDRPRQLRVHGVGGPQARKMLGQLDETDIVTVGPPTNPHPGFPTDGVTRFARPIHDPATPAAPIIEAYEWGGLTTGSWTKALWVLYLPFTLINAAGWAHAAPRINRVGAQRTSFTIPVHRFLIHVVAVLATSTYVTWLGYLSLGLVGHEWRAVALRQDLNPYLRDAFTVGLPVLSVLLFLAALGGLTRSLSDHGQYETKGRPRRRPGRREPIPQDSSEETDTAAVKADRGARRTRVVFHRGLGAAGGFLALAQYAVGWNRLGLVIIVLGVLQTGVLALLVVVELVGRWGRHAAADLDAHLVPDVSTLGFRLPVGTAFATVGTILTHATFSAVAMTLRPLLNKWPHGHVRPEDMPPRGTAPAHLLVVQARAELGAADVLAAGVVLTVVVLGLVALVANLRKRSVDKDRKRDVTVAMARQADLVGTLVALALSIPVLVYAWVNTNNISVDHHGSLLAWYDTYSADGSSFTAGLGQAILLTLPPAVWAVLSRPHDTGIARIIGNIWDVLTYWERDFHPFAVPCTAERAVPELRARIEWCVSTGDSLTIAAHSQGSILAVEALATAQLGGPVRLVTFGSPIGSLYAPTWPAHIPRLTALAHQNLENSCEPAVQLPWINFWRATDPIGAGVPNAVNIQCTDPRAPSDQELQNAGSLPPIERPLRPLTSGGHGSYLTDPVVRGAIASPLTELPPGRPFMNWAHQGGANEGPSNTLIAMRRAIDNGATGLEFDVHVSADGHLVVIHDGTLNRTTDKHGPVFRTMLSDLKEANAAFWWIPDGGDDKTQPDPTAPHPLRGRITYRIPELIDVLAEFREVPLTIEVKRLRAAAPLVRALLEFEPPSAEGRPEPVTVTALFGFRLYPVRRQLRIALAERRKRDSEIDVDDDWLQLAPGAGYLIWFRLRVALSIPPARSAYRRIQIPDKRFLGIESLTGAVVRAAHQADMAVDVWTLNEPAQFKRAKDLGVDGIMTDSPSVLAAWLNPESADGQ